ncbi:MAG: LEM-3-like GIY-YIG domain-containing protein [Cumulibacter sp.]
MEHLTHTSGLPRPAAADLIDLIVKVEDVRIPIEVAAQLRYYVYALRDPRNRRVFYIGKGKGSRINAHAIDASKDRASERDKLRIITEIEADGRAVDLLFLRTGIDDEQTAFIVEQAVIDAFYASNQALTNRARGHDSHTHGLASLATAVAKHRAEPCPRIDLPIIMVKIQKNWRPDSNEQEIFEHTRGYWKIAANVRDQARYCLGVAHGIVRGAYRIDSWFPSPQARDQGNNRWGFDGASAPELAHVVGTHTRDLFNGQAPYRKFLDGYPGTQDVTT